MATRVSGSRHGIPSLAHRERYRGEGPGVGVGGEDHPLRGKGFLETVTTEDPYPVTDVVTAAIPSCWVPLNMTTSDIDNVHNVVCGRAMTMMSACPHCYSQ